MLQAMTNSKLNTWIIFVGKCFLKLGDTIAMTTAVTLQNPLNERSISKMYKN